MFDLRRWDAVGDSPDVDPVQDPVEETWGWGPRAMGPSLLYENSVRGMHPGLGSRGLFRGREASRMVLVAVRQKDVVDVGGPVSCLLNSVEKDRGVVWSSGVNENEVVFPRHEERVGDSKGELIKIGENLFSRHHRAKYMERCSHAGLRSQDLP